MFSLLVTVGLLILGTLLLVFGADWFLDGASDLARSLGMSELVLGVLLAGLEPEEMLTAAIASARRSLCNVSCCHRVCVSVLISLYRFKSLYNEKAERLPAIVGWRRTVA